MVERKLFGASFSETDGDSHPAFHATSVSKRKYIFSGRILATATLCCKVISRDLLASEKVHKQISGINTGVFFSG
jgi:hypothetical protein